MKPEQPRENMQDTQTHPQQQQTGTDDKHKKHSKTNLDQNIIVYL